MDIQLRGDTAANWTKNNSILLFREPGLELDTKRFKIGDGHSAWINLPYFESHDIGILPDNLQQLIADQLQMHVQSSAPHPVYDYDDGQSLVLIYNNRKV